MVRTAAVVVIGREILTGKFADENGPFLIHAFRARGIDLRRLVVVDDVVQEIAREVRLCASEADLVITTGGVGPTHDDVTYEGIAQAFDVGLIRHAEIASLLLQAGLCEPAHMRIAEVPEGAELLHGGCTSIPLVRVRNVVVMPGIPALVREGFALVEPLLDRRPIHAVKVYATDRESAIASRLSRIASSHPQVAIGSYPRLDALDHRIIVTLESFVFEALQQALDDVAGLLHVVRIEEGS